MDGFWFHSHVIKWLSGCFYSLMLFAETFCPKKVFLHRSCFQKWSCWSNSSCRIPPNRRCWCHFSLHNFVCLYIHNEVSTICIVQLLDPSSGPRELKFFLSTWVGVWSSLISPVDCSFVLVQTRHSQLLCWLKIGSRKYVKISQDFYGLTLWCT